MKRALFLIAATALCIVALARAGVRGIAPEPTGLVATDPTADPDQKEEQIRTLKRRVRWLLRRNHRWHRYARRLERRDEGLQRELRELRARLGFGTRRFKVPAWFYRQALCVHSHESRDWHQRGSFRGGLQFTFSTWTRAGGDGDPADASPSEQIYRAFVIYRLDGNSWREWPNTSRMCGLA